MVIELFSFGNSHLSMLMNFYFSSCCEGFSPFATAVLAVVGVDDLPPEALTVIPLIGAVDIFHNIRAITFRAFRHNIHLKIRIFHLLRKGVGIIEKAHGEGRGALREFASSPNSFFYIKSFLKFWGRGLIRIQARS